MGVTRQTRHMLNRAMARKLEKGEALDARALATKIEDSGTGRATLYHLREYVDGKDYCDAQSEQWIWSIGRHRETGQIIASTDTRFYQNPRFECLWLR